MGQRMNPRGCSNGDRGLGSRVLGREYSGWVLPFSVSPTVTILTCVRCWIGQTVPVSQISEFLKNSEICEAGGPAGAGAIATFGDWVARGGEGDHSYAACAELCRAGDRSPVDHDTAIGDFDYPGAGRGV